MAWNTLAWMPRMRRLDKVHEYHYINNSTKNRQLLWLSIGFILFCSLLLSVPEATYATLSPGAYLVLGISKLLAMVTSVIPLQIIAIVLSAMMLQGLALQAYAWIKSKFNFSPVTTLGTFLVSLLPGLTVLTALSLAFPALPINLFAFTAVIGVYSMHLSNKVYQNKIITNDSAEVQLRPKIQNYLKYQLIFFPFFFLNLVTLGRLEQRLMARGEGSVVLPSSRGGRGLDLYSHHAFLTSDDEDGKGVAPLLDTAHTEGGPLFAAPKQTGGKSAPAADHDDPLYKAGGATLGQGWE